MAVLKHDFHPIGLDELVQAAASGRIPDRAVAVTLDDGYLDALTIASPILLELGIPATFFVNTDRLDEPHERPWDIFERIFLTEQELPARLAVRVNGTGVDLPTVTDAERKDALDRLNEAVWPLDAAARSQVLADVLAWSGAGRMARDTHRVLTGSEIRELATRPGHTIGAHTTHHLAPTMQPAATKRREIVENKAALERLFGRAVTLFAYPYGDYDAETVSIVSEAGFHAAVTVEAGTVSSGCNRLLMPRFEIAAGVDFPSRLREIFGGCFIAP